MNRHCLVNGFSCVGLGLVGLQAAVWKPHICKGIMLINISLRMLHIKKQPWFGRPFIRAFQNLLRWIILFRVCHILLFHHHHILSKETFIRNTDVGKLFFKGVATTESVKNILSQVPTVTQQSEVFNMVVKVTVNTLKIMYFCIVLLWHVSSHGWTCPDHSWTGTSARSCRCVSWIHLLFWWTPSRGASATSQGLLHDKEKQQFVELANSISYLTTFLFCSVRFWLLGETRIHGNQLSLEKPMETLILLKNLLFFQTLVIVLRSLVSSLLTYFKNIPFRLLL